MAARRRDSFGPGSAAVPSASSSSAATTSVQVAVRIRPVTKADNASIPTRWQRSVITPVSINALQVEASTPPPASGGPSAAGAGAASKRQAFSFDHVLSPQDGQEQVFSVAEPLIQRFIEGYNVTILAYGQTSSGKSYTMGTAASDIDYESLVANHVPDPQMGIIPRAVAQIFQQIKQNQQRSHLITYSAKASFIEIYNEDLIDLLADSEGDARPLVQIREGKGGQIIWSGLREVKVSNVADVMNQLERGSQIRRTNETDMNATSSRSHAIFSLTLTQKKYVGTGPAPPPTAAHPPSAFGGRTTPSGTQTLGRSGLPRPSSFIPGRVSSPGGGSRSNTPSLTGALSGRTSATGLRPASVAGTIRSASPVHGFEDGHARSASGAQDGDWTLITSKFHFVDLAGSERLKRTAAQGDRIKEGISINSGLHALGNVISALGDPAKARRTTHIPYRDSKLTRLLQDSLGGNAHTLMIACVSPTEYNVSETVNTLQYANRARNIKNKAELNEIEPGWEDVDYLQTQVLKLRREIGIVRSGGTVPIAAVTNGTATGAAAAASTNNEVLEWRDRVTDLNHRVSKLVAENVKLKEQHKDAGQDAAFFAAAAEPVVIEYEKTIDKLEGDYNLVKAALAFTSDQVQEHETTIEEQEARLSSLAQDLQSRETIVEELRTRLATLQDRESSAETYAKSLEAQLASVATNDDQSAQTVAELRKDITRLRSTETSTEAYVKDLEARLAKSEDSVAALTAQIERLEHDLERRDEAYKELQQRLELLDTGKENKELLEELDRRESRLLDLERRVEELADENEGIATERGRLIDAAAKDQLERGRLEDRIKDLQAGTAAVAGAGLSAAAVAVAKHSSLTNGAGSAAKGVIASAGNSDEDVAMLRTELEMLQSELEELRASEAKSKADTESLNQRYRESLREIDDLNTQVSEAKLLAGPRGTPSDDDADVGQRPAIARRNSIGYNVSGSLRRPRSDSRDRSSQTPSLSRRNSGSFLYKTGDKLAFPSGTGPTFSGQTSPPTPVTPRGRTSSQSLSQELSRGPRPLSLSASGTVPAIFFDRPEPSTPASYERTIKSLETETMRLQEALKERDEEIHALERSLKAQSQQSVSNESPARELSATANGDNAQQPEADLASTTGRQSPDTESTPLGSRSSGIDSASDRSSMPFTPATENEFKAIRQLMSSGPGGIDSASSEAHVVRLEEMMRSMARKDQSHREAAETAQQKIDTALAEAAELRRQKDSLEKLSSDQMANMSTEIEGLRAKLTEASSAQLELEALRAETEETKKHLSAASTAQADLVALRTEMELTTEQNVKREEEHAAALKSAKDAHAETMATTESQHAESVENLTRTHTDNVQRLANEHQALLDRNAEQHSSELEELKAEHARALQSKDDAHSEALSNADLSRQASVAETEEERDALHSKLQADHKVQLERVLNDHNEALERALSSRDRTHASEIENKTAEHQSAVEEMQRAHAIETEDLKRSHGDALEAQTKEHNTALEGLVASHSRRVEELQKEHEVNIAAAVQAAAISHSRAHDEATQSLGEQHREALASAQSNADAALQKAKEEHAAQVEALRAEAVKEQEALMAQHASDLETERQQHSGSAEATAADLARARELHAEQLEKHSSVLEATRAELLRVQSSHEETQRSLNEAKTQHTVTLNALRSEQSALLADRENKFRSLQAEHESLTAEHETVKAVNRDLDADPNMIHNLQVELADTSEALLTFESALTEAQRERDVLAQQVQSLRAATNGSGAGLHERNAELTTQLQRQSATLASAQSELSKVRNEVQSLTEERQKQDILLRDLQVKLSAIEQRPARGRESSLMNGLDASEAQGRSPNFRRGSSEVDEYRSGARTPTAKPPPPTPPPSMPPPPTPVGSINRNSGSIGGPRTSTSSNATRPESPGFGGLTRSSSTTSLSSHGPSLNGLSDAKLAKVAQEQADELQKMAKRLEHCETDLSANIDLVATLEAALNDSERNLRKSRAQLGETTRERDNYSAQAEDLRKDLETANAELERTRNSNIANQQGYESKLQAERLAKENARQALEARLEEVQRKKSSKLFCM